MVYFFLHVTFIVNAHSNRMEPVLPLRVPLRMHLTLTKIQGSPCSPLLIFLTDLERSLCPLQQKNHLEVRPFSSLAWATLARPLSARATTSASSA